MEAKYTDLVRVSRAKRSSLLSMNACSRVAQWIRHGLSLDSVRERETERHIQKVPRCVFATGLDEWFERSMRRSNRYLVK